VGGEQHNRPLSAFFVVMPVASSCLRVGLVSHDLFGLVPLEKRVCPNACETSSLCAQKEKLSQAVCTHAYFDTRMYVCFRAKKWSPFCLLCLLHAPGPQGPKESNGKRDWIIFASPFVSFWHMSVPYYC